MIDSIPGDTNTGEKGIVRRTDGRFQVSVGTRPHYVGEETGYVQKNCRDFDTAMEWRNSAVAGMPPPPRLLTPAQDHERTRHLVTALKKKGFTDKQKREIALRDGGCVGRGRYGPCSDSQPLALCQADHIDPDGLNAVDNGQMLCGNCHDWKTAVENGWWKP